MFTNTTHQVLFSYFQIYIYYTSCVFTGQYLYQFHELVFVPFYLGFVFF